MRYRIFCLVGLAALAGSSLAVRTASAQTFGVELANTLMPASGAMGGTSIARPQDVQSAFLNPASLTQFNGTQVGFGTSWAEPTITIDNQADLTAAGISPYQAKSGRPGSLVGNIAITQDFSAMGMPVTVGVGLLTASGLGVDYRGVEASQGTTAELVGLASGAAIGIQVTDRLSVGAAGYLTTTTLDGPFAGIGAAVPAYALRAGLGVNYDLNDCTTVGGYWLTRQSFQFDDAVILPGPFNPQDLNLDFPETFGIGIANSRMLDGRLLLAADVSYKKWSDADFFDSIWEDQLIVQLGAQYTVRRGLRLRLGYAYAENISRQFAGLSVGGVVPDDLLPGVQYIQAQFAAINPHRLTAGVGMQDVLPGVDLDLFGGGMFRAEEAFGDTSTSIQSYWVGMGLTWRFGRGAACPCIAPSTW